MKVLVIPTNRPEHLQAFFDAWGDRGGWDRVIVVEDAPKRSEMGFIGERDYHYDWSHVDRILGDRKWIISRKDSAIRSFGFLAAWHMGADYVLTLDDDCFPTQCIGHQYKDFFAAHIAHMNHPVWIPSAGFRTRGLPYKNLGKIQSKVNVGLWRGVMDWDSIQALTELAETEKESRDNARCDGEVLGPIYSQKIRFGRQGNDIIPAGQIAPVCGMNLCFHRDAIPLMYFPLMGDGQPYARFDDIWAGVIVKKIMDHLHWRMSVGEPHIEHKRASDPFKNLVKEAPGIAANETFWEKIWDIQLGGGDWYECSIQVAQKLQKMDDPYMVKLGEALDIWRKLFKPGAINL